MCLTNFRFNISKELEISFSKQLVGTIPRSLCQLNNLKLFDLSFNSLTGTIPDCLGKYVVSLFIQWYRLLKVSQIFVLYAVQNQMLQVLILNSNFLVGTLPAWLGQFPLLTRFDNYKNRFSGTIPHELG